jgi:hypothetical protein
VAQLESVGDVIGRAVRLFRFNYAVIVQALFPPTIVFVGARTLLQWGFSQQSSFREIGAQIAICLLGLLVAVWAIWRLTLIQLALMVQFTGAGGNFKEIYRAIEKKQVQVFHCWWLTWTALILNVIIWTLFCVSAAVLYSSLALSGLSVGLAILVIGFITLIGLLGGTTLILAFWILGVVISASENEPFGKVCDDCLSYISRDFFRACYYVSAISICISAMVLPLSLPPIILGLMELSRYSIVHAGKHLAQVPFYLLVFGQVWESIVNMILWPIIYFSAGLYYRDLKIRQRASDVLQNLEKLKLIEVTGA